MSDMVGFRGLAPLAIAMLLALLVAAPLGAAASGVGVAKYSSLIEQASQEGLHHQGLAYYETRVCGARVIYTSKGALTFHLGYKSGVKPSLIDEAINSEVAAKAGEGALEYIQFIAAARAGDDRVILVFVRPDTPRHVLDVIREALENTVKGTGAKGLIVVNDLQSKDADALKGMRRALEEAALRLENSSDTRKLGIMGLKPYVTILGFVDLNVWWEPGKGPTPQVINAIAERLLREAGLCGKNITIVVSPGPVVEPLVQGQAQSGEAAQDNSQSTGGLSAETLGSPAMLQAVGLSLLVAGLAAALALYLRR